MVDLGVRVERQSHGNADVVMAVIGELPEWFGRPEANDAYAAAAGTMTTVVARAAGGEVVGLALLAQHFPTSAEVHLMAVVPAWHRKGVGRALLDAAQVWARGVGAKVMTVKTLGPSDPDPEYAKTRAFYEAMGFVPLEELSGVWTDTPCLVMAKPLV